MRPTLRVLGASRRPLTGKKANKDYYKGTGVAQLPGGHRTGPPGAHVVRGRAKYRIIDEKVRVFVAPPVERINNSPLKAYVHRSVEQVYDHSGPFGSLDAGRVTGQKYLQLMQDWRGSEKTATTASTTQVPTQQSQ
ncbi:hypothetical protein BKA62DRAFT_826356 [Auriculariales sp. MPI-PUGE-AT-0066]|nr:hypothetical protein BKA62DRAFT_826356 [Auriculariales sp. MPI-PUGE-AT-0066]